MGISINDISKVTAIVENNKYRPKDRDGNPGGLLDLSSVKKEAIVIGDLHGAIENLRIIIDQNKKKIKSGKSFVIILGDGEHNDQTGHMREMDTSLEVMEEIFSLILTYKENIIYIRGNHDTFDERLAKSGIKQGLEFKNYLLENRGEKYVAAMEQFFEALPYFIIGNGWVITHAGPVRGGATREELINIADNEDYRFQLVWNRLHEFRGTPSLKEYGEYDIRQMLKRLNLPEDTPFIVGHNPMWGTGNRTGIWRDIIGIKNHIIIYCSIGSPAPYLTIQNGEIKEVFGIKKDEGRAYVSLQSYR